MGDEMNVEYLREMKQNYLMFEVGESQEQGYEARMMIGNSIEGLLKFRIKKMDNQCKFCYEITSKQPLSRLLETTTIGEEQTRRLMLGIIQTLTRLEDYLLAEEQILLEPDYIYVNPETYQSFLCLIPGKKGSFPEEFSKFLQFLLEKVDHQDKEAVVLVYGLYRESLKENYGLGNLLKWLVKEDYPIVDSSSKGEECETINPKKIESWKEKEAAKEQEGKLDCNYPKETVNVSETKMWYLYFLPAGIMFGLAAGTGLFFGSQGLKKYGSWIAAIGLIFLIIGGAFWFYQLSGRQKGQLFQRMSSCQNFHDQSSYDQQSTKEQKYYIQQSYHQTSYGKTSSGQRDNNEPVNHIFFQHHQNVKASAQPGEWQIDFEEPEEMEEEKTSELPKSEPEELHTVLLWNQEEENNIRRLISLDKGDDILLSYFPFIIGKQEGLCDYIISKTTISRLHIRIDEAEDGYLVTDLNSTNGTYVNNKCLEANESVSVQLGDEIGIADLKFQLK